MATIRLPSSSDFHRQRFAFERDLIAVDQFAATPCLDFTIDADFAVLDEQFRLAARVDKILPLHERVEFDGVLFSHFVAPSHRHGLPVSCRLAIDRQRHLKLRSGARLAVRSDRSAMRFDEALGNCQPQA